MPPGQGASPYTFQPKPPTAPSQGAPASSPAGSGRPGEPPGPGTVIAGLALLGSSLVAGGLFLLGETQRTLLRMLVWDLNAPAACTTALGVGLALLPLPFLVASSRRSYWLTPEHLQVQDARARKRAARPMKAQLQLVAPPGLTLLAGVLTWTVIWKLDLVAYRFPDLPELELVRWVPKLVDALEGPGNLFNAYAPALFGGLCVVVLWLPLAPYWERFVERRHLSTRGPLPDPGDYQRRRVGLQLEWRPWPTMLLGAREGRASLTFEPDAQIPSWVEYGGKPIFGGMLIFGQKGSGKTSLIKRMLEDLIRFRAGDEDFKPAIVAIDPKGDLSDFIEKISEKHGRRADVVRLGVGTRAKWNPFGLLGPSTTAQEAKQAGYFLRCAMSTGQSENAYWDDNADNLLTYSIHLLALSGVRVGFDSLASWVTTLKEGDEAARVAQYEAASANLSDAFEDVGELERRLRELDTTKRYFEDEFVHLDTKPRSIIVNVCTNFLRRFEATEYIDSFCCDPHVPGHFVGFPELIRTGQIFVLDVRATENGAIAGAMAMLAKLYYQAAVKQRDRYEPDWSTRDVKRVTATVWDEYQSYLTTSGKGKQGDAEYLETSRSFFAVDIAATQQLSSIEAAVGGQKAAGARIAGSFNNLVSFMHNDPVLARYLQQLVGQRKREELKVSVSEGVQGAEKDRLGTLRETSHSVSQQVNVAEVNEERLPYELFAELQAFEAVGLFTSEEGRKLVRFASKPYFVEARKRHAEVIALAMQEGSG